MQQLLLNTRSVGKMCGSTSESEFGINPQISRPDIKTTKSNKNPVNKAF